MKHLLKKTLSLILCIAVVFSFTACGSENVYEGPWWTQLGGNAAHTGSIDTEDKDYVYPSELPGLSWEHQINIYGNAAGSALVYAEGNIYFGCTDGYVYCLKDGKKRAREIWKYPTEGSVLAGLIYDDGVIYCCGLDGCVYALNAKNGKLIWFKDLGGTDNDGFTYSPVITKNNTLIVGTDKGVIYSLSLEEGSQGNVLWSYTTPNNGSVNTHLTYYDDGGDGVVFYGSYNTYYYALNARTGKFMWDFYTTTIYCETPTAYDGYVYIPSGEGILYCIDINTGKTKWKFECEQGLYIVGPAAVHDGKVIFGSFDYNVYCLDAYNGNKLWNYKAEYVTTSAPVICGNRVYIGISSIQENRFYLYCLDLNNGTYKWSSAQINAIEVPATVINGSIFYTTAYGKIVKLSGDQNVEK